MKRSEAVEKLAALLETFSYDLNNGSYHQAADRLLDFIQNELEMASPPDYTETYYSSDEPGGYHPRCWEDEEGSASDFGDVFDNLLIDDNEDEN